jgi:hypothetical protein
MPFQLGIVQNQQFLHFNQQTISGARYNVGTALLQQGWNPAISIPGANLFNHERFYEPVEESIHFQMFASGIDAPSRIHRRMLEIDRYMKRISYRERAPEMPPAFLFYSVSGVQLFSPADQTSFNLATPGTFVSPIISAQLILPEEYMRTIHLKMALDVEARIVRNGLFVDAEKYAYRNIKRSVGIPSHIPATFTVSGFTNLSPYVNTLDVRVDGFKNVSGRYWLPRGYTIYHDIGDSIVATASLALMNSPNAQFTTVTESSVPIVRYTPTTTGYTPFVAQGDLHLPTTTVNFASVAGESRTFQVFATVRSSGVNTSFALQPMVTPYVTIGGNSIEAYGRETIISNIMKPTPIYLGEVKTQYRNSASIHFRMRRITGSGVLDFHTITIIRDDKVQAVYHDFPQFVSGFLNVSTNPADALLNIEGNTMGALHPANDFSNYGRGAYADEGASIRLSSLDAQPASGILVSDSKAYTLSYLGNHAMPYQFGTHLGFENPYIEPNTPGQEYKLGITLLWCGGNSEQSWRFTYPSGVFSTNVWANMAGLWPTVPRLQ